MGAPDVLARLSALGVRLTREGEAIRAAPRSALTDEARSLIQTYKGELLAALVEPELFTFSPPDDPANDDEALQERVAIMAEGNGWDDATALQEARWQADRERAWRAFLRNAARVQAAPQAERGALLARYCAEAERRYGERTALDMAQSLASWVRGQGVH